MTVKTSAKIGVIQNITFLGIQLFIKKFFKIPVLGYGYGI